MPYRIAKYKQGYRVMSTKRNTPLSKNPLPYETALKQFRAVSLKQGFFGNKKKGGATPSDQELYDKVKQEIYAEHPKHSAYRSMMVVKKYKDEGGKFKNKKDNKMNTKKWLKQKWTSANDYYHTKEILPCGSSDTEKKYGEYPLCRPLSILKKLTKKQMKQMIDKKDKLGKKQLVTAKVLKTEKFNIKPTLTGLSKSTQ